MAMVFRKRALMKWASAAAVALMPLAARAEPLASLDRNGSRVSVEPYAANIVRVTIALDRDLADAAPGPGPNAKSDATGWTHRADASGDIFASSALSLTVDAQPWPKAPTQMERYFAPSVPLIVIDTGGSDGAK